MRCLLSDTFFKSFSNLHSGEQTSVLLAAAFFWKNPGKPGHYFELESIKAADPGMQLIRCKWSSIHSYVYAVIVWDEDTCIFCYVGHQESYEWAKHHRIDLLSSGDLLSMTEIGHDGQVIADSEDTFVELSEDDKSPSLLAEKVLAKPRHLRRTQWFLSIPKNAPMLQLKSRNIPVRWIVASLVIVAVIIYAC